MKFVFSLVFRVNWFHAVSFLFLLWLGLIFWGLGTTAPSGWGTIVYSLLVAIFIICITNFADMYSDRFEDRTHRQSNPMATGEFKIGTAKRIFIAENIIGVLLVVSLFWVTRNYPLILALVAGWVGGLIYSLPPFRLKARRIIGPLEFGLCCAIIPLVGWLVVKPVDTFIAAFALIFFVGGSGIGITTKLRRTAEDFSFGLISGSNVFNLKTTDFGLRVKTAVILEAILVLGAICLIPVFGFLGTFNQVLVIFLVSFVLPLVLAGFALRGKDPISNLKKAQISFILICATLPAISVATFISSIVHIG